MIRINHCFVGDQYITIRFCFLVPSAPADIKVVTSGETSSIVSWRAPALPNGIIQKYTVYRREVVNGEEVISKLKPSKNVVLDILLNSSCT